MKRRYWAQTKTLLTRLTTTKALSGVAERRPSTRLDESSIVWRCRHVDCQIATACKHRHFHISGYTIITAILILSRLVGEGIGWKTSIMFSLVGAVVFAAAGGVIISGNWIFFVKKEVWIIDVVMFLYGFAVRINRSL